MVQQASLLVTRVKRVDGLPGPPRRRRWARRLAARPATWPAQIGCLGHPLVALLPPWPPGQGPPRGLGATCRVALGAVFGYHLALLSRHDLGAARRMGLKAFIRAA